MDVLRKLNNRLGATVGYEVRKAPPRGPAPATGPANRTAEAVRRSAPPAFGPPGPADRLLTAPVFVISSVRSGSTLLRLLLNGHSRLHAPHELHIRRLEAHCGTRLSERAMRELGLERGDLEHLLWDRVMHRELVKSGKEHIVEKTPGEEIPDSLRAMCATWRYTGERAGAGA